MDLNILSWHFQCKYFRGEFCSNEIVNSFYEISVCQKKRIRNILSYLGLFSGPSVIWVSWWQLQTTLWLSLMFWKFNRSLNFVSHSVKICFSHFPAKKLTVTIHISLDAIAKKITCPDNNSFSFFFTSMISISQWFIFVCAPIWYRYLRWI